MCGIIISTLLSEKLLIINLKKSQIFIDVYARKNKRNEFERDKNNEKREGRVAAMRRR
jgi:hypothetical protein